MIESKLKAKNCNQGSCLDRVGSRQQKIEQPARTPKVDIVITSDENELKANYLRIGQRHMQNVTVNSMGLGRHPVRYLLK